MATPLTPLLRLQLIQEQKDRLHEEELAIYSAENKRLEAENARQAVWIDEAVHVNQQLFEIGVAAGALTSDREDMLALYRR
jgi:phosphoglycolate phosphatase-like HAD superfamily hydrolase